jgi:chromatin segregation and condensation protein Rec8/ScpA/Scc1 (kleisin family)
VPDRLSVADEREAPENAFHRFSAWATTFSAGLELAKLGHVAMAQEEAFASVHVSRPTASPLEYAADRLKPLSVDGRLIPARGRIAT